MAVSTDYRSHQSPSHGDDGDPFTKKEESNTTLRDVLQDYNDSALIDAAMSNGREALDILVTALLGDDIEHKTSPSFPSLKLQSSRSDEVSLGIIPLNFFAWNLWMPWDTLSICALGTPSADTFFELACSRILGSKTKITIVNADKSTATIDLCIASYKIQLSYHSNPLVAKWSEIGKTSLAEVKSTLLWTSQERIDELITTQKIATRLAQYDIDSFRACYWQYLRWAVHRGLFPNLLDNKHIICLAVWGLERNISHTDFRSLNRPVPTLGKDIENVAAELGFKATKWEAWKLQTVHHIAGKTTFGSEQPSHINYDAASSQSQAFLKSWPCYLRVDLKYWGSSSTQASRWVCKVENSLKATTLSCSKDISLGARLYLWPHPFTDDQEQGRDEHHLEILTDVQETTGPYQKSDISQTNFDFTYFIGLSSINESENKNELNTTPIYSHFAEALTILAGPECSCSPTILTSPEMIPSEWHATRFKQIAMSADLRKFGIADLQPAQCTERTPKVASRKYKPMARQRHYTPQPSHSPPHLTSAPSSLPYSQASDHKSALRPAVDILNRIRHDSRFDTDDFLVGYLDRHTGVLELPVDQWVLENTHEAFIPQSRIRYFKRKSDGGLVWDRDARVDRVFGSGRLEGRSGKEGDGV